MMNYIKRTFGIDDVGAKNLINACIASFITTLAILFTNIVIFMLLADIIVPILEGQSIELNIAKYAISILVVIILLVSAVTFKYKRAYLPVYAEAAKKRINLAERLRKLPLSYFGKKDIADITTTIMKDASALEDTFSAFIPTLFSAIVGTFIMCIAMFIYNPIIGLAIFWCIPISLILCVLTRKIQTKAGQETKNINIKYLDELQQCIENIKDMKANNREEYHKEAMFKQFDDLEKSLTVSEFKIGSLITSIQMILKIGMASTAIVSVNLLIAGNISILEFILILMAATRIYDPLQSALVNLSALFQAFLSIDRMKEFEATKIQEGSIEASYDGYDIEFKNVTFAYDNIKDNIKNKVIDNLSIIAKQGEVTALVGPSGGGKTTVLKLAARFWDLQEGKITIGNKNIEEVDPETLLNNISIVFQDVTLFNNTVLENIRVGKKDATDEEVIEAAKNARCHDFIMEMADGYNTLIGENGSKLSGGERQRISIARALLKDAPIVLLDEATSSLDIKNETAIQEAIAKLTKNKTVLVIAHRMRTIAGADKIIVLKDGKVAQIGNHDELINKSGEYATMVKLQTDSINWKLKV